MPGQPLCPSFPFSRPARARTPRSVPSIRFRSSSPHHHHSFSFSHLSPSSSSSPPQPSGTDSTRPHPLIACSCQFVHSFFPPSFIYTRRDFASPSFYHLSCGVVSLVSKLDQTRVRYLLSLPTTDQQNPTVTSSLPSFNSFRLASGPNYTTLSSGLLSNSHLQLDLRHCRCLLATKLPFSIVYRIFSPSPPSFSTPYIPVDVIPSLSIVAEPYNPTIYTTTPTPETVQFRSSQNLENRCHLSHSTGCQTLTGTFTAEGSSRWKSSSAKPMLPETMILTRMKTEKVSFH